MPDLFGNLPRFASGIPQFPKDAPKITTANEVFGISRDFPLNYRERDNVDNKLFLALAQKHHIVIHGSSKQGKTCLRKWNIKERKHVVVACIDISTLAELNAAVLKAAGYRIEQSESKTVSGKDKINARVDARFQIMGQDLSVSTGKETENLSEHVWNTSPLELDPENFNDMIRALDSVKFDSLIILEDFHYLPSEVQKLFSRALKGYFDYSNYRFVIIGVWLDDNKLLRYNGDLGSRIATVNADRWARSELEEVISSGEDLLGVTFSEEFKACILDKCLDSVWVVQEACYNACVESGILGDSIEDRAIGDLQLAEKLIGKIVQDQSSRSESFIDSFSAGPTPELSIIYQWTLFAVIASDIARIEGGLGVEEITEFAESLDAKSNNPKLKDLILELPNISDFQMHHPQMSPIVLDYDFGARRLNVVDRSFLIWLSGQNRVEVLRQAGMPGNILRQWQLNVHEKKNLHHRTP